MEESLLSTDYKKHIQVQGGVTGGSASSVLAQSWCASLMDPESEEGWNGKRVGNTQDS